MRTKWLTLLVALVLCTGAAQAGGGPVQCQDWNGYVASKNVGPTGAYTLEIGAEEKAAQTYHYSGPGKIGRVRVSGSYTGVLPLFIEGVPLRVTVYGVDANGRPTSEIESRDFIWWETFNAAGNFEVSFGSGVYVSSNFAVGVSIRQGVWPYGQSFQLKYTGNGEGLGKDLASLAGTSTGFNWASAKNAFSKDGDFYVEPEMVHFNTPHFSASATCIPVNGSVSFTNQSVFTRDSMFNLIGWSGYAGSAKYYNWDFGDGSTSNLVSPSHTYTSAGKKTVTLTTTIVGWDVTCTETYTMDISVGLSASTNSIVNVSCHGGDNGSVVAVASGGASPFEYALGDGEPQSSPNFGSLSAGNYTLNITDDLGCTASANFAITQPSAIVFGSPQTTLPSCGGTNGQILVAASGGSGQIQYKLGSGGTYGASGLFTNLASGSYEVFAKDANNCTKSITVVIGNTDGPTLTVLSQTNISCFGGSDGTITLIGSGGIGALQYSINGGTSYQSTTAYTGLAAGTYAVLVKDAANCKAGATVVLTQPSQLSLSASSVPTSCFGSNDGQVNVYNAIGGIGALSYSLNGTNYQSGTNFSGLGANTYTVYVRDVAGCTATTSVVVSQPVAVSASVSSTNPGCYGSSDGSIQINANGGNGGYSYSLDGDNFEHYGNFFNLPAGGYTVFVKDRKGCTFNTNVNLTQPAAINGTVTVTNATCGNNNGSLLVSASGGSGSGYQYSTNGVNFQSANTFSGLNAGTYYVVIRDGSGCEKVVSGTISNSDGPVIAATTQTDVSCNSGSDGSITVTSVTGGTGVLQYGLNGAYWQSSNNFSGLSAGNYTVMVRDANQCIGLTNVTIAQPQAFVMSATTVDILCSGASTGSINVSAGGGAGTLAYSINGGASYQSSSAFTNLSAGTYNVRVRDAAGCTGTISATLTEPSPIVVTTGTLNVSCNGEGDGSITVLATGGTGSKTFSLDGSSYQSSGSFSGLGGGVYSVYIKDGNNCVVQRSVTVVEPTELSTSAAISSVSCAGGNNGVINLSAFGGVGNYSFGWSSGANSEDLFNLPAGNYTVTVSDANGCSLTSTYSVSQPTLPLIVNGTVTGSTGSNGVVDITITGGVEPYVYNWTNGELTQDISGLAPGTYTVEVTDFNGCATSNTFTVDNLTGINETEISKSVRMFPNPANNVTTLVSNGTIINKVMIYDVIGQLMLEVQPESNIVQVNTTNLQDGLYIVKMQMNNQTATKQLQIIR